MSTTYFVRVEGRTKTADLVPGVAARVYDPAWMLGRQWQIGELLGEDAGSPVSVQLQAETAMIARYRAAGASSDDLYDPTSAPLEAIVEAVPIRASSGWTARLRVDSGRAFVRALRDAGAASYVAAYRRAYKVARPDANARIADPAGARLLDVAADRVPDGEPLYSDLAAAIVAGQLPADPIVAAPDVGLVQAAAIAWLVWCASTLRDAGASAWTPELLAHSFSIATANGAGATTLDAAGYRGGNLDWHAFDCRPVTAPSGFTALPPITVLPTGVRFRGMPNARWWEFEDAAMDMGSVDAGASDVARLALLEFALVYGNDFFAVPLRLPVGSLTRITSIVVPDTFGMSLLIEAAARGNSRVGADRWSMFTLSERTPGAPGGTGVADLFFLPPIAGPSIAGRPVEETVLLRDEMANLAWAVERRYEGGAGVGIDRIEEHLRAQPAPPAVPDGTLSYRLGTSVPLYWFPLVPEIVGGERQLNPERMADAPAAFAFPRGRFLDLDGPSIREIEVPREGTRLVGDYVFARWIDGSTVVWARRRRRVGRGEGSSGLRFDVAAETGTAP